MQIRFGNLRPTRTGHLRLLPNINCSDRELPPDVSEKELASNTKVDKERPIRKLSDKEIYPFFVDISAAEWAANPQMSLQVSCDPQLFQVLDQSAKKSPFTIDLKQARISGTKSQGIQFFLEAQTFWGSPLVTAQSSPAVSFHILDAAGKELLAVPVPNANDLRTADIILVGDDAPPERIFLCELDENQPSVREVSEAAKAAGVPLTLVPKEVAGGDSWLQDQFQVGYTATPEGEQRVILHLPRMRNDAALFPGTANLRNFVDTYFPSKTVGVVKDFWSIKLTLSDQTVSQDFTVAQSYVIQKRLGLLVRLLSQMFSLLLEIDKNANPAIPGNDLNDIYQVRIAIEKIRAQLMGYRNLKPDQKQRVLNIKPVLDGFVSFLELKGTTMAVKVTVDGSEKQFAFDESNSCALKKFYSDASDLHSSQNYGGNVEVSPPFSGAPFGKILTGSVTSKQLRSFLTSRGTLHPVAQVNTEWLGVGHIDEIAAFAPATTEEFSVLRASPKLAMDMMKRLIELQKAGTLVTRLLRGKKWIDESSAGSTDALTPPSAYRRLLQSGIYDLTALERPTPYSPTPPFVDAAYHDDRQFLVQNKLVNRSARYAAMISCADLLEVCGQANRAAEDLFLANSRAYADDLAYRMYYETDYYRQEVLPMRLDKVLADEFPGVPVYPVPVLFDYVANYLRGQTSAVMPAVVNFQTLGKHVLVPRPYGPRMPVPAAIDFIKEVLAKVGFPKTRIDENFIRSRGLDKTWHWTGPTERVNRAAIGNMPTEFDPDYEEMKRAQSRTVNIVLQDVLAEAFSTRKILDTYTIQHQLDPLRNHPVSEPENLYRIAGYFKDGFPTFKNYPVDYCKGDTEKSHPKSDQYEKDIQGVMDKIRAANPAAFDKNGNITAKSWIRLEIPEDNTDVFEVYTAVLMEALGMQVHWVDSWYYHTHFGGIHCGTNVLRNFVSASR
jgi:protein-arginine deiminase (PAD)